MKILTLFPIYWISQFKPFFFLHCMSMTDKAYCSMKNINVGQSQAKIKHMLGFSHTGQQHLITKEKCVLSGWEWL